MASNQMPAVLVWFSGVFYILDQFHIATPILDQKCLKTSEKFDFWMAGLEEEPFEYRKQKSEKFPKNLDVFEFGGPASDHHCELFYAFSIIVSRRSKIFHFFLDTCFANKVNESSFCLFISQLMHFTCYQGLLYPIIIRRNNHGISLSIYHSKKFRCASRSGWWSEPGSSGQPSVLAV